MERIWRTERLGSYMRTIIVSVSRELGVGWSGSILDGRQVKTALSSGRGDSGRRFSEGAGRDGFEQLEWFRRSISRDRVGYGDRESRG